jgi:hypothetical protein
MLIICQVYVVFIALIGFIFGQLFFGHFDFWSSVAGLCGILAGILGIGKSRKQLMIFTCSVLALIGVLMGTIDYYMNHNIHGNNYGWGLRGPYVFALLYLGYEAIRQHRMQVLKKDNDF